MNMWAAVAAQAGDRTALVLVAACAAALAWTGASANQATVAATRALQSRRVAGAVRRAGDAWLREVLLLAAVGLLVATAGAWHWWACAAAAGAGAATAAAWAAVDAGRRRVRAATAPLRAARTAAEVALQVLVVWARQLAVLGAGGFVAYRVVVALW